MLGQQPRPLRCAGLLRVYGEVLMSDEANFKRGLQWAADRLKSARKLQEEAVASAQASLGRWKFLPKHQPPEGYPSAEVNTWIAGGGRGSGKTMSGAMYAHRLCSTRPGIYGRIIAPSAGEAVQSCLTGPSGVCTLYPEVKLVSSKVGPTAVWPNGSKLVVIGAWTRRDIKKLRAFGNSEFDWFEEFTHLPNPEETWTQASLGRRIGDPHAFISTTPTPHPFYKRVLSFKSTVLTEGTMYDNPYLSDEFRERVEEEFGGTSVAAQEIEGKVLSDDPNALWNTPNLDEHRLPISHKWADKGNRVLTYIGVDVDAGVGTTGIVTCALVRDDPTDDNPRGDAHLVALDDTSKPNRSPKEWANAVITAWEVWDADLIVVEKNQGGAMIRSVIETVAKERKVKVRIVERTASKSKEARAQPIALLSEQGSMHILGKLHELENELTNWVPGNDSPDRLDAMVWAMTELKKKMGRGGGSAYSTGSG